MRLTVIGLARQACLQLWSVTSAQVVRANTHRNHPSACGVYKQIQWMQKPVYIASRGWSIRRMIRRKDPGVTDNTGALRAPRENRADGGLPKDIETKERRNVGYSDSSLLSGRQPAAAGLDTALR